jgi:hypothetical protein
MHGIHATMAESVGVVVSVEQVAMVSDTLSHVVAF